MTDVAALRHAVNILRETLLLKKPYGISFNIDVVCRILEGAIGKAAPESAPEIPPYFWLGAEAVL